MGTRERILPPAGGGTPPPATDVPDPVDEGPMRRELLRQIAQLERRLSASTPGWESTCPTPRRGPALQPTSELERLRDELHAALRRTPR